LHTIYRLNKMNQNVKTYFDRVAGHYLSNSRNGLWGWLKKKEADAVVDFMDSPQNVLDLGCGSGYYSNIVKDLFGCHVTCVDISAKMLSSLDSSIKDKTCASAEAFIAERRFDLILCIGMLEFSNDPGKVFDNASKMLSSNGTFIILIPTKNIMGLLYKFFHKAHGVNVKLYDMKEIEIYASHSGLMIQQVKSIKLFSTIVRFVSRKNDNEK
jgi:ubiquinone/menaquinone biosynthesis C-methylase UbiE